MKKVWKCCSALMLALVLVLASGCNPNYRPEFEYGDFICREWGTERRAIAIKDLSEQGRQKRVLIIPEEVNGMNVGGVIDPWKWGGTSWESDKLEKVYLPQNITVDKATFKECVNLKIFVLQIEQPEEAFFNYVYDDIHKLYIYCQIYRKFFKEETKINPANITYYYNDGRTENYGCYWLDDVPYGSVLDVLPPEDPVSKGKRFAGWFKEPECINEWNFETDTTPEEMVDEEGNIIYQETALYAKWV